MKRALALLLVSALSLSLLSGCSAGPAAEQLSAEPISLTAQELAAHGPDVQDACDALSSFGLELLQNTEQSGESTLLSPLSVILALSMAANGAEGETLAQFQEALGGVSLEALNAACQSLLSDYRQLGGSTGASIASQPVGGSGGRSLESSRPAHGDLRRRGLSGGAVRPAVVDNVNRWCRSRRRDSFRSWSSSPSPRTPPPC